MAALAAALALVSPPGAGAWPHSPEALEEKVEAILSQLTLEEKVAMCLGGGGMEFKGVPRLDLPNMNCTDGPRGPGQSTGFPTGLAFGASWNPALVGKAAEIMGVETRAKGATMLLAPAINILRDPLNGRFFEYFTEDPHLNSELTVAFVQGLQSQGVASSVKHYAANNRDANRDSYSSEVDRRTLEEIYLPAFKAGVQRGGAWSVMICQRQPVPAHRYLERRVGFQRPRHHRLVRDAFHGAGGAGRARCGHALPGQFALRRAAPGRGQGGTRAGESDR